MSDPAPAGPGVFRLLASLGEAGSSGDASAQTVLGRARLAGKILLGLFVLNFLHGCSTLWRDGPVIATVPVTLRVGEKGLEGTARLNLERSMSRVNLRISHTDTRAANADFDLTITGPDGRKVASKWFDVGATNGAPPANEKDHWISSLLFDVERDGEHEVQIQERTFEPKSKLPSLTLSFSRNTTQSHFISNSMLLAIAAWLASVWWRRTQALPWWNQHEDRTALAAAAPAALVAGVSPLAPDLDPPTVPSASPVPIQPVMAAPQTAPGFSAAYEAPAPTAWDRIQRRFFLEGFMLLVSALRLPIIGSYAMLTVIGLVLLGSGVASESFGAAFQAAWETPGVARVIRWIIGEGDFHYQGMDALNAAGFAALKVLLPFHLIAMVVRAVRPEAPVVPVGRRLKRLFYWNVALLGVFAVGALFQPRDPGTDYLEMIFFMAVMIGFIFVPAAILLMISAGLEHLAESYKE